MDDRVSCAVTECPRSFNSASKMRAHVRSVHEGERYACAVEGCALTFTQVGNMQRHVQAVHEG